jgi:hypothetical protein
MSRLELGGLKDQAIKRSSMEGPKPILSRNTSGKEVMIFNLS